MLFIDYLLLIALSAIWGSSFIFMRILAPVLGPVVTADLRLLIAGIFLSAFLVLRGQDLKLKTNWDRYLITGLINSGIPFLLFSFAALYLPASVSVIINSLSPLFGVLFSFLWKQETMTLKKMSGIFLGIAGVAVIRGAGNFEATFMTTLAMGACILATMFYGFAGTYVKRKARDIPSSSLAAGSQLFVGILFIPLMFLSPMRSPLTVEIAVTTVIFSLLCSAIAYVIFYRLLINLGPTKALSVTFLIPVFGFVWGALFLKENITPMMIIGSGIVLSGIYFVTGKDKIA